VKLLYAIAFAFFPLAAPMAAPTQSPDVTLLSALCQDDYYEDTAGQCAAIYADEALTVEALLGRYEVIVTDDEIPVLNLDDPEDIAVGSILPPSQGPTREQAAVTDDESKTDPATGQARIAANLVPAEPQHKIAVEPQDDVSTTGPTAQESVPLAATPVEDDATIE
jgi:hypothetical protein